MRAEEQYSFELVEVAGWIDGKVVSNPEDGWESKIYKLVGSIFGFLRRSDEANWYALVGTVDKDEDYSFAILSSDVVTIGKSGLFFTYANDMQGRYFNNHGVLKLKITRVR